MCTCMCKVGELKEEASGEASLGRPVYFVFGGQEDSKMKQQNRFFFDFCKLYFYPP